MRKHPRRVHPERGGGGFARRRPKISLVYMVQKSRGMLPVVSTRALERFASAITASMRPCRELPFNGGARDRFTLTDCERLI